MTTLSMAWRTVDPAGELVAVIDGQAQTRFFEALSVKTNVRVVRTTAIRGAPETFAETVRAGLNMPAALELQLVPAERLLITSAVEAIAHCLRLADATLKPLEPEPGLINLAPGDAYVALIPGQQRLTPEARLATARFIHLRDYFNADKLAVDLLKHLHADDDLDNQPPPALGALVIECR